MTIAGHESVLLQEAVEALAITSGETIVDATVGGAGHFRLIAEQLADKGKLIGIDADEEALERARAAVPMTLVDVRLVQDNFSNLDSILDAAGVSEIDGILFDLGWSGYQLARGRGFSFKTDEPLLMTYGEQGEGTTAADMVNTLEEDTLADLIYTLGEERFSRRIAKSIVAARKEALIETTFQLVAAIEAGVPSWYRNQRLHPATKTFQALRIAVNDELGSLREGLAAALRRVGDGGRVAVITFHSIEDRIVKSMLRDAAHAGQGTLITKKPIVPSAGELKQNPRARSAKLRVFERGNASPTLLKRSHYVTYA